MSGIWYSLWFANVAMAKNNIYMVYDDSPGYEMAMFRTLKLSTVKPRNVVGSTMSDVLRLVYLFFSMMRLSLCVYPNLCMLVLGCFVYVVFFRFFKSPNQKWVYSINISLTSH